MTCKCKSKMKLLKAVGEELIIACTKQECHATVKIPKTDLTRLIKERGERDEVQGVTVVRPRDAVKSEVGC